MFRSVFPSQFSRLRWGVAILRSRERTYAATESLALLRAVHIGCVEAPTSKSRGEQQRAPLNGGRHAAKLKASETEIAKTSEGRNEKRILTLPTVLTLGRVVAIPLLVAGFFLKHDWSPAICTGLFIAASVTDWLDGYLARRMNTFSSFGAFLDPVADKLMVAAALILLCSGPVSSGSFEGNRWILPTLSLIIIGREITMSSLREWAASVSREAYKAVAVSSWGKVKTASQMTSIVLLLLTSDGRFPDFGRLTDTGLLLLSVAAFLSLYSLALYFRSVWKYL